MENRISYLRRKFADRAATSAETEELMEMVRQGESDEELELFMNGYWQKMPGKLEITSEQSERILSSILNSSGKIVALKKQSSYLNWTRTLSTGRQVAAAAMIILMLGTISYFVFVDRKKSNEIAVKKPSTQNDIPPGREGAILTL